MSAEAVEKAMEAVDNVLEDQNYLGLEAYMMDMVKVAVRAALEAYDAEVKREQQK